LQSRDQRLDAWQLGIRLLDGEGSLAHGSLW
jgi:hypothetical protein